MLFMTGLAFLLNTSAFAGEPVAAVDAPRVELAVGRRIVDRQIARDDGGVYRAGETIYLWTQTTGLGSGFVEHIWMRDGVEVARHYLPVGAGRRWRTWSRHIVSAGSYKVDVIDPRGQTMGGVSFVVAPQDARG